MRHRFLRTMVVGITAAAGFSCIPATSAFAAACNSAVRYATSTNTIYLVAAQSWTLPDIKAACPSAPLQQSDSIGTWELSADLILQNGATLVLHGPDAASPGTVRTLRLRSLASNQATEVSQITAQYGTLDVDSVTLTSWDDAAGTPDTNPNLPTGAASTNRGRAFIRALSVLASDGTPQESTMRIVNSDVGYLGYYAAETYGVAFKARGCDHTNPSVCDKVKVYGEETNSRFHHNFMGTYTWGAYGIRFTGNEYDHNIMYGLDPHDVSRNLLIDSNHFHHNGDHGVICSQLCDRLTITNNESDHNGMVPWAGPKLDADTAGQVHGIMIHRGVSNTIISGNNVHDQPNGAGIAVFDSAGATITNNALARNLYGLRVSVGSRNNTFRRNTIVDSGQYGIYLYRGTDLPSYTTASGRPTDNLFGDNTIAGTSSNIVKLSEADGTVLDSNIMSAPGAPFASMSSTGTMVTDNTLPSGFNFSIKGSASVAGSLTISGTAVPVRVGVDQYSRCDFTSAVGTLYAVGSTTAATTVKPTGSSMSLTAKVIGTSSSATVTPLVVTVTPAAGAATALATFPSGPAPAIKLSGQTPGVAVDMMVGGLSAGTSYVVRRDGQDVTTATASSSGRIQFSDTPLTSAATSYTMVAS